MHQQQNSVYIEPQCFLAALHTAHSLAHTMFHLGGTHRGALQEPTPVARGMTHNNNTAHHRSTWIWLRHRRDWKFNLKWIYTDFRAELKWPWWYLSHVGSPLNSYSLTPSQWMITHAANRHLPHLNSGNMYGKLHHPSLTHWPPDSLRRELMAFSMFNKEHELFPLVWLSN